MKKKIEEKEGWSNLVIRWQHKDGTFRYLESNAVPILDSSGNLKGFQGADRDITERKKTEEVLRESEERFRELFNSMSSGVAIYKAVKGGKDFIFIDFNKGGESIDNVKKEDLIGKSVLKIFPGVKEFGLFDVFKRVYKSGKPEKLPIRLYKDNRISGWRENYVYKLSSGEIVAIYDDSTEIKMVEEEKNILLKETLMQHKETKALLDGTKKVLAGKSFKETAGGLFDICRNLIGARSGCVMLLNDDGNEESLLESDCLKCVTNSTQSRSIKELKDEAYKSGKPTYNNKLENNKQMNIAAKEYIKLKNVLFAPLIIDNKTVGLIGFANKDNGFTDRDANTAESFSELASIALKESYTLDALLESQEKLKKTNEELENRVAERTRQLETINSELEAFAYSVSHDLKTPLRHINGFSELLFNEIKENLKENTLKYFNNIKNASARMNYLISDLLSFSKMARSQINLSDVNINQLIHESIEMLSNDLKDRNIQWIIKDIKNVRGDLPMLREVISNLITNAVKYTKKKKKAVIEIGSEDEENENVIYIKDNGAGFDSKYKSKLFRVFQRLHSDKDFEGTGIGLALVKKIIERHKGRVWAEGKVDKGATFYFSLPKDN